MRTLVSALIACFGCSSSPPPVHEAPAQPLSTAIEPAPVIVQSTAKSTADPKPEEPISPTPSALAGNAPKADAGSCAAETIGASHILVAWGGAMRAKNEEPVKSRSKEQALVRAREVLAKARAGGDFAKLAAEYTDEQNAASRGGKIGRFGRGRMVQSFEDAAFALCPGELSDVVETPFGYHVILRTE